MSGRTSRIARATLSAFSPPASASPHPSRSSSASHSWGKPVPVPPGPRGENPSTRIASAASRYSSHPRASASLDVGRRPFQTSSPSSRRRSQSSGGSEPASCATWNSAMSRLTRISAGPASTNTPTARVPPSSASTTPAASPAVISRTRPANTTPT